MVRVPAPSIAPQGSINHSTALPVLPGGKSCILHTSPLEKKKQNPPKQPKKFPKHNYFSCSLKIRQGTTYPMAVLEPQKGQRMERRLLADRVGSRERGPDEHFSMLASVSEVNSVFLTWS